MLKTLRPWIEPLHACPGLFARLLGLIACGFMLLFALSAWRIFITPAAYVGSTVIKLAPVENWITTPSGANHQTSPAGTDTNSSNRARSYFCLHALGTECAMIQSDEVMREAIANLNPAGTNGAGDSTPRLYGSPADRRDQLRSTLSLSPLYPDSIEIRATSAAPAMALQIAQTVAEAYQRRRPVMCAPEKWILPLEITVQPAKGPPVSAVSPDRWASLVRAALGSMLLACVPALLVLVKRARACGFEPGAFTPVFLAVMVATLGIAALLPYANLAFGLAVGLWLGFVAGSLAYWIHWFRPRFTDNFRLPRAVAVWTFGLLATVNILGHWLLPSHYSSAALVRVGLKNHHFRTTQDQPGDRVICNPGLLATYCEAINSPEFCRSVVVDCGLHEQWTRHFKLKVPLTISVAANLLRRQSSALPVQYSSVLKLEVTSEHPAEAARLANAFATNLVSVCRSEPEFWPGADQIDALIIRKATPARNDIGRTHSLFYRLLFCAMASLIVGGGAFFMVWSRSPAGSSYRALVPTATMAGLTVTLFLALVSGLADEEYEATAQANLVITDGNPEAEICSAPVLDRETVRRERREIESEEFCERVISTLAISDSNRAPVLRAVPVPGTSLLEISARSPSPVDAERVANAAVLAYQELRRETTNSAAGLAGPVRVQIFSQAERPLNPAPGSPLWKPLRFVALIFGLFLTGLAIAWLVLAFKNRPQPAAAS